MLRRAFCLPSCLASGDDSDKICNTICELLDRNLKVVDPVSLHVTEADKRQTEFQAALLEQCHVAEKRDVGVDKRRKEATKLLDFFVCPGMATWVWRIHTRDIVMLYSVVMRHAGMQCQYSSTLASLPPYWYFLC